MENTKAKGREFYTGQIVELVEKIENVEWLMFIYRLIKNLTA